MKKVLIFVISAQFPPYDRMIPQAMETWDDSSLEGTETIFYCGEPDRPNTDRIIYFQIKEGYDGMGHKDLAAYRWALECRQWDYMARVNASCYVHKRRLRDHCQQLPDKGLMRGLVVGAHPYCGVQRPFMWGGGQYIFSRDVVQTFVDNGDKWNHGVMEDCSMSELAHDTGIVMDTNGRVCSVNKQGDGWVAVAYNGEGQGGSFATFKETADSLHDQFFFRVKNDGDRTVDAEVMRLLKQYLPA